MVSRQESVPEGVEGFVLRRLDGIEHDLAEVGQGGGGLALYASLGHAGEDLAESGAEIAGGDVTAGEHEDAQSLERRVDMEISRSEGFEL
jgi:hypothetical protein